VYGTVLILSEEIKMEKKTIVLTMYGKNDAVENISISIFDNAGSYIYPSSNVENYCENINSLELIENNWVYASIIDENKKISLKKPFIFDTKVFDIINNLDDRALQKRRLPI
jgi:hypothetical protein